MPHLVHHASPFRSPSRYSGAALALVALFGAAPLQAQQRPPVAKSGIVMLPIDKVVAVVGEHPVLYSDVKEYLISKQAAGMQLPTDSAGIAALERDVLEQLIDDEVLVNAAKRYKIEVTDAEVQPTVDRFVKDVKGRFATETEFRDQLKKAGFGNENEFRKFRADQDRRQLLITRAADSLRAHGRMSAPIAVSEKDVTDAYEKSKEQLPTRPATVAFRQIMVATRPSAASRKAALAKAESLLVEVNTKGADFAKIAKRESMDAGSKDVGGDLGWNRRNQMVAEFDQMMFALGPGQISPFPVETSLGFHIIKVEQRQPAEVKARHILIMPKLDSADVVRTKLIADTVLRLWKSGTPFDSLRARYHDNAELTGLPEGMAVDSLPEWYKKALNGVKVREFTAPFEVPNARTGFPKIAILQVTNRQEGGAFSKADLRDRIKSQLQQERQGRRMLDELRKEQFVQIRM